jgi:MFS family permease
VRISGSDVAATVRNPRILMHVLITLTVIVPVNAINTYGPSVIKSLGYTTVQANALASVGLFVAVALAVLLGWLADRTGRRGPFTLAVAVWSLIAFSCLRESHAWVHARRYAAAVFSMATNSLVHILNVGWLSINCRKPQERSIAMA